MMHFTQKLKRSWFLPVVFSCAALSPAHGQSFPDRPVRFIVASTGSPQDVVGRLFAQKMSESWGQPIVVENRAGAGSLLSIQTAAKSPPDGYTVLVSSSAFAVTPSLYKDLGYDSEKDLIPIALLATAPNVIVTHPDSGIRTLQDAVERAKSGKDFRYASPGFGTTPQLSADYLFKVLAKVDVMHVPYKGIPPTMQAILGNQVDVASVALPPAAPLIQTGRLVGLAVTSRVRSKAIPDVSTIGEAGFTDFEDESWVGAWVPAGTPPAVVEKLRKDFFAAAQSADVKERLSKTGFEASSISKDAFAALVKAELQKWEKVVRETDTKVE